MFGEGECLHELRDKCVLGGKGIHYDPLACQTCGLLAVAEALADIAKVYKERWQAEQGLQKQRDDRFDLS